MDKIGPITKNVNYESNKSSSALQSRTDIYFWSGKFLRVPETWDFPMRMTLKTTWFCYHLNDHNQSICAMKHLPRTDVYKASRGKRKLCNYHKLMHFMIDKAKQMNCYVDNPDEDQVQSMYEMLYNSIFLAFKESKM